MAINVPSLKSKSGKVKVQLHINVHQPGQLLNPVFRIVLIMELCGLQSEK